MSYWCAGRGGSRRSHCLPSHRWVPTHPVCPTPTLPLTPAGSCGYGTISKDQYPYFTVAALSPQNSFYQAGPLDGCGECFAIQCTDPRPGGWGGGRGRWEGVWCSHADR